MTDLERKNRPLQAVLWALVCVALWALIPVVSKLGQQSLDNHQFLFWSSLTSFVILLVSSAIAGTLPQLTNLDYRRILYLGILGLLGTYIYYLFLYLGYATADGIEVLVVQYTWPFFIVILSFLLLNDPLNWRRITAVILGFLGVAVVLIKGELRQIRLTNATVILLVLIGALSFALYSVLSRNVRIHPLAATTLYFFTAAAAAAISMTFFSEWKLPSQGEILPIVLNGILINGFSYVFWIMALQRSSPSFVAQFIYLTPVVSAVYLVLIFRETFYPVYVLGFALVMLGGLINSMRSKKRRLFEGVAQWIDPI